MLLFQDDINLSYADGTAAALTAKEEDPEDSGQKALNYRTEPLWNRMGYEADSPLNGGHGGRRMGFGACPPTNILDFTNAQSNLQVGGDPETPVFTAQAGTPGVPILEPGGHPRGHVFQLHGHIWQDRSRMSMGHGIRLQPAVRVEGEP